MPQTKMYSVLRLWNLFVPTHRYRPAIEYPDATEEDIQGGEDEVATEEQHNFALGETRAASPAGSAVGLGWRLVAVYDDGNVLHVSSLLSVRVVNN